MKQRKSIKPLLLMVLALAGTAWIVQYNLRPLAPDPSGENSPRQASPLAGTIISTSAVTTFSQAQAEAISRQNYSSYTPKPLSAVTKTVVQYYSTDLDGQPIKIYARIYQPTDKKNAPIFGFASGTVGMGDQCAPSLEQPEKINWANYESHMVTYAGQGYATVITDYEGMRDPGRIHHYMVGALEGRAVIDSVRALIELNRGTDKLDTKNIFLGGYSQGGHAAFWADQISPDYAPTITIKGVVGWGPVMDVQETLADVTHAANINWFGPYIITSYSDYYKENYQPETMLLPQWSAHLRSDVLKNCIDTDLKFWGHDPAKVYTPEFIQALSSGQPGQAYQRFFDRLHSNIAGNAKTGSAKLINQGGKDNVVLPQQQIPAIARICASSKGPGQLHTYAEATHYTAMEQSLADTLIWMKTLRDGNAVPNQCVAPSSAPLATPSSFPSL